jgi:hypothetical protein
MSVGCGFDTLWIYTGRILTYTIGTANMVYSRVMKIKVYLIITRIIMCIYLQRVTCAYRTIYIT